MNKEISNILYYGFLIRKSEGIETTFVVSSSIGYIVTDPIYGRYSTKVCLDGKTGLLSLGQTFFVYAKNAIENNSDDELTKDEVQLIHSEIKKLSQAESVEVYEYKNEDNLVPIFRNFNTMHDELSKFMDKVCDITSMDDLEMKKESDVDHKHFIVKKSFDKKYYTIGSPYNVRLKSHPASQLLRDKKRIWVTGILTYVSDDELSFVLIEPAVTKDLSVSPMKATNICLSIDDVDKYDICIDKYYTEDDLKKICSNIVDVYHNRSIDIIGKPKIVSLDFKDTIDELNCVSESAAPVPIEFDYKDYSYTCGCLDGIGNPKWYAILERTKNNTIEFTLEFMNAIGQAKEITIELSRKKGYEVPGNDGNMKKYCIYKMIPKNITNDKLYVTYLSDNTDSEAQIFTTESLIKENEEVKITIS